MRFFVRVLAIYLTAVTACVAFAAHNHVEWSDIAATVLPTSIVFIIVLIALEHIAQWAEDTLP